MGFWVLLTNSRKIISRIDANLSAAFLLPFLLILTSLIFASLRYAKLRYGGFLNTNKHRVSPFGCFASLHNQTDPTPLFGTCRVLWLHSCRAKGMNKAI
jgi:hypothetical protein